VLPNTTKSLNLLSSDGIFWGKMH